MVSQAERELIKKTLSNDRLYIETFFSVRTKEARLLPFRLNPIQKIALKEDALANIHLKPRQVGMSTILLARRLKRVMTRPNWTAVSIAHNDDTTELLFQTVKLFYDNLNPLLKPATRYNTRRELFFHEINSRYIIFTAGSAGVGRGATVNDLHGSEVAYWPDPENILGGLMETVPKNAHVDLESTANGAGGFFHQTYEDAKNYANGYRPHFYPWWLDPGYYLTDEEARARNVEPDAPLDAEEQLLVAQHNLTRGQINWRRWKKSNLKRLFYQEYPESDTDCFLTSGNTYFDTDVMKRAAAIGKRPPEHIRDNESLKVWADREVGKRYIIAADVAEGILSGDADAAYVIDAATGNQVAALHGRWNVHTYAQKLSELGRYYNNALLAVERNNHGHAVLTTLKYELFYPNLYKHVDYDKEGKPQEKLGWDTNSKTKPIALAALADALEHAPEAFPDERFHAECLTFVELKDGKLGAMQGCHDDRVMAAAIGRAVWKSYRPQTDQRPGFLGIFGSSNR